MYHVWGLVSPFNKMIAISFTEHMFVKNRLSRAVATVIDTHLYSVVSLPLTIVSFRVEQWQVFDTNVIVKCLT